MFSGTTELASAASGYIVLVNLVAGIDLTETAVTNPPAAAVLGGTFAVSDTTLDQGTAASAASTTRYYLSADPLISAADRLLTGSRPVPALSSGAVSTGPSPSRPLPQHRLVLISSWRAPTTQRLSSRATKRTIAALRRPL